MGGKIVAKIMQAPHSIKGAYELCGKLVSESDYTASGSVLGT